MPFGWTEVTAMCNLARSPQKMFVQLRRISPAAPRWHRARWTSRAQRASASTAWTTLFPTQAPSCLRHRAVRVSRDTCTWMCRQRPINRQTAAAVAECGRLQKSWLGRIALAVLLLLSCHDPVLLAACPVEPATTWRLKLENSRLKVKTHWCAAAGRAG